VQVRVSRTAFVAGLDHADGVRALWWERWSLSGWRRWGCADTYPDVKHANAHSPPFDSEKCSKMAVKR